MYLGILSGTSDTPAGWSIPDWPELLLHCWHIGICNRSHNRIPIALKALLEHSATSILYDPLTQNNKFGKLPDNTWPPVWKLVLTTLHDGRTTNVVLCPTTSLRGSWLSTPLLDVGGQLSITMTSASQWSLLSAAIAKLPAANGKLPLLNGHAIPKLLEILNEQPDRESQAASNARTTIISILTAYHTNTASLDNSLPPSSRLIPYYHNFVYGPAQGDVPHHPFESWNDMRATRRFLEFDKDTLTIPPVTIADPAFTLPHNTTAQPPWNAIRSLNAPPQARSTVHRLALGRMPARRDNNPYCHCGILETIPHMLNECHDFAILRDQFFHRWTTVARNIYSSVRQEMRNSAERKYTAARAAAIAADSASTDPNIPSLAATLQRPPPAHMPIPLPTSPPQIANWVVLPLVKWATFAKSDSQTAKDFHKCFELATSLLIHLHWVARNDHAYSGTQWSISRFTTVFNRDLDTFAYVTLPASSTLRRFIHLAHLDDVTAQSNTAPADHRPPSPSDNSPRSRRPP
ncbi:hypothetical protein GGF37_006060 [Kickxella alabastrina]|nr:hypothetical protein GGF37_006060 [Kickxella alabastrina]